jgi:lysine-specific demethylase 8
MVVTAQIVGHKSVWLAPPSLTSFMYPYPPTLTNTSDKSHTHNPAANNTNPSMSNTSQVDVFALRAQEQETTVHPLFWEMVVPYAISVTLEPGDLLFFPP